MLVESERVLHLKATCIQRAIQIRYGHGIPFNDAIDLARVHTLYSALDTIRQKLAVHAALPEQRKYAIAVSETKVANVSTGMESTEHVVRMRQATIDSIKARNDESAPDWLRVQLDQNYRETKAWFSKYEMFLDDALAIMRDANRRIDSLRLSSEARAAAIREIGEVIAVACRRAAAISQTE